MAGRGLPAGVQGDVRRVAAWLEKAIRGHQLDGVARRWAEQPVVAELADPSSPAWHDFTIHVPLLHKVIRWFIRRFRTDVIAGLESRKAALDALLADAVAPLGAFDDYLVAKRKRGLEAEVARRAGALHGDRWWDEILAPSWLRARAALWLLDRYNQLYMATQRSRHAAFFDGSEYRQSSVLNDDQVQAVLTNEAGTIAIAGPGSGKTKMLVDRVAFYMVKHGIPGDSVLVLAYNRAAAEEVQQRLKRAYDIEVDIRTFHSLGFKIYSLLSGAEARSTRVEGNATRVIRAIVEQLKKDDPGFQKRWVSYFTRYFDDARGHPDDAVLREMLAVERLKPYTALDGTAVRSIAERGFASFPVLSFFHRLDGFHGRNHE